MIPWCAGDSVVCLQSSKSIAQVETGPILQMPGWPAWKQKCFYIGIGWEGMVDFVDVRSALVEFDVKHSDVEDGPLRVWIHHTDFDKFRVKEEEQNDVRETPDDLNARLEAVGGF